ncbi:MAG: BTAD domain-containing putative transcriptional regulator [Fimbriimonadales bacterium]
MHSALSQVAFTAEREQRNRWLEQVQSGRGGVLLIAGEMGTGRTSFLRDTLQMAQRHYGLLTADTWCQGEPWEPAWFPLSNLIEQVILRVNNCELTAPLQELLSKWLDSPQSWHIPMRMIRPLRALARQHPLLLAIDDFHLAHESTVRLIQSWLPHIRLEPLGIVLTLRQPIERAILNELVRACTTHEVAQTIALRAFTYEELHAQVHQAHAELANNPQFIRALWELTQGNPLFVSEILRTVKSLPMDWHQAHDLTPLIPTSLRATILNRMDALPEPVQDLLRWVSCFEGAVAPEILAQLTRSSTRALQSQIATLRQTNWFQPAGSKSPLLWQNRLVREVVYETLSPSERAQRHADIAQALEATGGSERDRLYHWMRTAPSEEVLNRLWRAYQQLRGHLPAPFRLELLQHCLQMAEALHRNDIRIALLGELPYLLYILPDGLLKALDASERVLAELAAHPELDRERSLWVQVSCARAGQLAQMGRAAQARAQLESLLSDPDLTPHQRVMAQLSLAYTWACQGNLRSAYEIHRALWETISQDAQWLRRWIGILRYALQYALACGDVSFAEQIVRYLPEDPDETARTVRLLRQMMLADLAFFQGDSAQQQYRARILHEASSDEYEMSAFYEGWFLTLLYREPSEAVRVADQTLNLVRQAVGYERETEWRYLKALALIESEQFDQAMAELRELRKLALKLDNRLMSARALLAQIQLALWGYPTEPVETLMALLPPLVDALALPEVEVQYYTLQSAHALSQADPEHARAMAERAVQIAESWGHAFYRGWAHLQYALCLAEQDDPNARHEWEQAESLLASYGAPQVLKRAHRTLQSAETPQAWEMTIRLLGEVQIRYRRKTLGREGWASPRARAIVCHLILAKGQPLSWQTLCEQHFPHFDPEWERTRVNLQTTISAARRSLRNAFGTEAGNWIAHEAGSYRWLPPHSWTTDVLEFERVALDALALSDSEEQKARLQVAIQLYPGDLTPEFKGELWCEPYAHYLRSLYIECLMTYANAEFLAGAVQRAMEYAERALQCDPCNESAVRLLMRAHTQLGSKQEALHLYAKCQQTLKTVLEAKPSEPTRQLYESIRNG